MAALECPHKSTTSSNGNQARLSKIISITFYEIDQSSYFGERPRLESGRIRGYLNNFGQNPTVRSSYRMLIVILPNVGAPHRIERQNSVGHPDAPSRLLEQIRKKFNIFFKTNKKQSCFLEQLVLLNFLRIYIFQVLNSVFIAIREDPY